MKITRIKAKPTVATVNMTNANTEYSYELPVYTREYKIKLRNIGYVLQLATVEGQSGATYTNIAQGATVHEKNVKASKITLYFRSSRANMTAEIISWK